MELSEKCIAIFEKEGFPFVYEWTDAPNTIYEEHKHQDKVSLFVTDGSIEMNVAGEIILLTLGKRYDVPPHTKHSAVVGPDGCNFVVGEMIDGDS